LSYVALRFVGGEDFGYFVLRRHKPGVGLLFPRDTWERRVPASGVGCGYFETQVAGSSPAAPAGWRVAQLVRAASAIAVPSQGSLSQVTTGVVVKVVGYFDLANGLRAGEFDAPGPQPPVPRVR